MNFYHDIKICLLDHFEVTLKRKYFRELQDSLQETPLFPSDSVEQERYQCSELIRIFLSYNNRLISPIKRSVFLSKELTNQLSNDFQQFQSTVNDIAQCLRNGQDVLYRLSTKMEDILYEDRLLNDWRIYHLHLGPKGPGKFCQRSGPVLIAFIPLQHEDIYLLQIIPQHDTNTVFADKNFLHIIKNNWPEAIEYCHVSGLEGTSDLTIEQRAALRAHGLTTADIIEGEAYIGPGIGLTSAGTSIFIQLQADRIYNWIVINTLQCQKQIQNFIPRQIPEYLDFKMIINFEMNRFEIYSNNHSLIACQKY